MNKYLNKFLVLIVFLVAVANVNTSHAACTLNNNSCRGFCPYTICWVNCVITQYENGVAICSITCCDMSSTPLPQQ